jgi:hypothetical protein
MSMRLEEIMALSLGPDGKPNLKKIQDLLGTNPDDPVVVLIEAFLANEESCKNLKLEQVKHVKAIEEVLRRELAQLVPAFGEHRQALAKAKVELGTAFAVRSDQLETHAKQLAEQAVISTAATQLAMKAAERRASASAEAAEKIMESAANVDKTHRRAVEEAELTHKKLQELAQSLSDREQFWLYLVILIVGSLLGIAADHWLILPHWNS